ncbi:transcription factor bHLH143-like [Silene latifolia]|uniref:transcription factor bHLH143-like n=1 Tax=Silene latifolia TaxID=37657 RepID=UPI003D76C35A
MGEDLKSWLHRRQLENQFPNSQSLIPPFDDPGMQNTRSPCVTPYTIAAPTDSTSPTVGFSGVPNIKSGPLKEQHGWFYCLPRSRQCLVRDKTLDDKCTSKTNQPNNIPSAGREIYGESNSPTNGSGPAIKQFLVFDQTGDKTTMMFASGIGTSIPRPTTWTHRPTCYYNFNEDEDALRITRDVLHSGPNLADGHRSDERSDMRENSEEINALLYSEEEDDDSDDGEEASTGNSPSTMTAFEKQEWVNEEVMDEVASSAGPMKRQKLSRSGHQVPPVKYPSHIEQTRSSEYEDDAESSCAMPFRETNSSPGNKRMRREKIRETVRILQTILPGGKGKDAITVLDEAIHYLKTLKFKAESLALSGGCE